MNDGAADPWGRFWIGSMAFDAEPGLGNLFRYAEATGAETILRGLMISDGLGWSPNRRTMCFVDSGPSAGYAFDVDDEGGMSNQRTLVQLDHLGKGTRTACVSTPRARSGSPFGVVTRCDATRQKESCGPACRCRPPSPRAAQSAARGGRRSTSPRRKKTYRPSNSPTYRTRVDSSPSMSESLGFL
jgi:hypothetical protein